jgi:hypothetical protein
MLTYVFFNARAMEREEIPQLDWAAFYDSLEEDEEVMVEAVQADEEPEDRAEQMALIEEMAVADGMEMLTQEA